ncbi:unnamed protein product [Owenia fusiformis]|uniref:Uncharacterized protein n=1 Tax=Owenia fusiformis TaxID=6347 RepID=A0A8S4P636_OWEFU|nr:unnamed protein product [Owenia fusiformis]
MASIYNTVKSCIIKTPPSGATEIVTKSKEEDDKAIAEVKKSSEDEGSDSDIDNVKENDAPELISDKKTDELMEPPPNHGMVWKIGSGVWGLTSGTVGLGVNSVKWVAGKGYDATSAVVTTGASAAVAVKNKMPTIRKHPKKD